MAMILLLLIVPLLCIVFCIYVGCLVNMIIYNSYDMFYILISVMISLLAFYGCLHFYFKSSPKNAKTLNYERYIPIYHGYFSFFLLLLLGLANLANYIIYQASVVNLFAGLLFSIIGIYVFIVFGINYKQETFFVSDIFEENKRILGLELSNNNGLVLEYYVDSKSKYKIGDRFSVKYHKHTKIIKNIALIDENSRGEL